MIEKEFVKNTGYEGCRNCEHQIAPLRSCEWAEQGGAGIFHIICPMWDKRREKMKESKNNLFDDYQIVDKDQEVSALYGMETVEISQGDIEQLKEGKRLYITVNDEYAVLIYVGK